jgi:caspase domain-containing protein/glucodextranase-like protein
VSSPRTVVAGLLVLAALLSGGPPLAAEDPIPQPQWAVGDWWEVTEKGETWRRTVVGREGARYVLVRTKPGEAGANGPGRVRLLADADGWVARTIEANGTVTDSGDKHEWVTFPLTPGKRWFYERDGRTAVGGVPTPYSYDCRAQKWESIDVGGKSVRAVKIGCSSRNRNSGNTFGHSAWYAPDAKRLVRVVSHYQNGPGFEVTAWSVKGGAVTPPPVIATPRPAAPPVVAAEPEAKSAPPAAKTAPPAPAAKTPPAAPSPPAVASAPPARDDEAPKITLNYPTEGATLERDQITIVGLVTDNVAVDRVLVSVNGVMAAMSAEQAMSARGWPIRATVTLQPGENVIEVSAVDKAGNAAQLVRKVRRPGTTAAAPPPAPPKNEQWAVVIGVGRYESGGIPRLRYSVPDAEAVHAALLANGYKKDNIVLLTDRTDRKPTLKNIKWALGTFLSRAARKDDTVVIFFAGHGAPEIDPRGVERDGLAKYLIPADADPDDLFATALPMDDLQTIFSRLESERVVAFLDACYSGQAGGRTFAAQKTRALSVDDLFLERLARAKGRAIITASGASEVSIELAELGHGLFTYFLVQGLKGAADADHDGIVTLDELYSYVQNQVGRKSRAVGGNQHPVMRGELMGLLPLAKVRK